MTLIPLLVLALLVSGEDLCTVGDIGVTFVDITARESFRIDRDEFDEKAKVIFAAVALADIVPIDFVWANNGLPTGRVDRGGAGQGRVGQGGVGQDGWFGIHLEQHDG